jgi:large subunit ribosomal protein L10
VDRSQKQDLVTSLKATLDQMALVVVTHYTGLTVAELTDLRAKMRKAGAGFKVTKNRLTRLALEGTRFKELSPLFKGPTGIAFSEDPVAAAKVAVAFAKDNEKLAILGGSLADKLLDANAVKTLATLPSLDEQRAILVRLIMTPATRIAGVVQAPPAQLARVIAAYGAKSEAA